MKRVVILLLLLVSGMIFLVISKISHFSGTVIITISTGESERQAVVLNNISQYIFNLDKETYITLQGSYYDVRKIEDSDELVGCLYDLQTKKYVIDKVEYIGGKLIKKQTIIMSDNKLSNPIVEKNRLYYFKNEDTKVFMYDMCTEENKIIIKKGGNRFDIVDGLLFYNKLEGDILNVYLYNIEDKTNKLFRKEAYFCSVDYLNKKIVSIKQNTMYISDVYTDVEQIVTFDEHMKLLNCAVDGSGKFAVINFSGEGFEYETRIYALDSMKSKRLIKKGNKIHCESIFFLND